MEKERKKRVSLKGILIFAIIIGGPGSLFFALSRCEHHFKELPEVGVEVVEGDTVPFTVPDMQFTRMDGTPVSSRELMGEMTVFVPIRGACPDLELCNVILEHVEFELYKSIRKSDRTREMVRMVGVIPQEDSISRDLQLFMEGIDSETWVFVMGDLKPAYSFIDKGEVFHTSTRLKEEGLIWDELVMLVDNKDHVRAVLTAERSGSAKEMMDRIRLLKKEYDKKKKK